MRFLDAVNRGILPHHIGVCYNAWHMNVIRFIIRHKIVFFLSLILFVIPFFWFEPGAMDLGGDGTRLYFYDPISFIRNVAIYSTAPEGKAVVDPTKHGYLVYVGLIALLQELIGSQQAVVSMFHGFKLAGGFLSVYFIVQELVTHGMSRRVKIRDADVAAIIAGLFYIFSTGSESLIFFWVKALHVHDQIVLNPLIFLLLLRYALTKNISYLYTVLLVTILFSANFTMTAAPQIFSFYPLALISLFLYVTWVRKQKIVWRHVIGVGILFLGLHAFHALPEIMSLFDSGSIAHTVVFKDTIQGGVNFFTALRSQAFVSIHFLLPPPVLNFRMLAGIPLVIILLGFLWTKENRRQMLLTGVFFLITMFLVSANITTIGAEVYRLLFYIPGFAMFRHFFVQWAFVYLFFYALLFGQALVIVLTRLRQKYAFGLIGITVASMIVGFWPFLSGGLVNGVNWTSNDVRTAMHMDPVYEDTLEVVRALPDDGKIVLFPLTDNFNQVLYGINDAAYVGPPTISWLTDKQSFAGYQNFYPYPIPEDMMRFAREQNIEALTQIFSLFNIRYIFHNTDTKIYEGRFPNFPNNYMMTSFPETQDEYKKFVSLFPAEPRYTKGPYTLYELDERVVRPLVYIPEKVSVGDMVESIEKGSESYRSVFIAPTDCESHASLTALCDNDYVAPVVSVNMKKLNPTHYIIHIQEQEDGAPFLLVFQNNYHSGWKLSIDNHAPIGEENHFVVNRYANAWLLPGAKASGKTDYFVTLELATQTYVWYGLGITVVFVVLLSTLIVEGVLRASRL